MTVLVEASDVSVRGPQGILVEPVSVSLQAGVPLTIVGETGSGKSLLLQALLGSLPAGLRATGTMKIGGTTFDLTRPERMRRLWGRTVSVLPQEPWLALDPLMRSRDQVAEVHQLVRLDGDGASGADADLHAVHLSPAGRRLPGELSGGMAQRLAFAAARAGGGSIQFADEPTKGLDTSMRDGIADLLTGRLGTDGGLLTVTHDLDLARKIGGEIMVMLEGMVVERSPAGELLDAPLHGYTKKLVAAQPSSWPRRPTSSRTGSPVLSARNLTVVRGGRQLLADIDVDLEPGCIVGVFGPSGCGKTTLGNALLGLVPVAGGRIWRDPAIARTRFQKIWQDPPSAFARKMTLAGEIEAVASLHSVPPERIGRLRDTLRLPEPLFRRLPGEVSGGELQRVALLRALLVDPVFLFADEPTSRLDTVTQREVVDLLGAIVREERLALLIVSHDRDLLERICDRVIRLGAKGGEVMAVD